MINLILQSLQRNCGTTNETEQVEQFNKANQDGNIDQFVEDNILKIPCGVEQIQAQIYRYSKKEQLKQIQIPDTVTQILSFTVSIDEKNIPAGAFINCTQLEGIDIPYSVQQIGQYAFANCINMKSVYLPDGNLTTIEAFTFGNQIPQSITTIKNGAFHECGSLSCVHIANEECTNEGMAPFENTLFMGISNISQYRSKFENSCLMQEETQYNECEDYQYEKYYFYIGEAKRCIAEHDVFYYLTNNGEKLYVNECPYLYNFKLVKDQEPTECIIQCPDDQLFINNGEYICTSICEEEQIEVFRPNDQDTYICQDNCEYKLKQDFKMTIYNKEYDVCIYSQDCIEQGRFSSESTQQCVKTCKTVEGYTFTSSDNKCVTSCGQDSSNQPYVWEDTRLAKQCTKYTDCSQLNTTTDTYQLVEGTTNQCINIKSYCNNTNTYYINEYDPDEKTCILECDSVWYQYTTTDTTSRKVCMIEETCAKAQITFNNKQLKYRKGNGDTIDNYECVDICGTEDNRLVSFNYNKVDGDYICTDQSECVMISGYGKLYRNQDYECVKQCDSNVVWYEGNSESICTTQETCQGDQIPIGFVKVTEDNQCVQNCTKSVNGYIIQSNYNDNLCVQYCRDQNDNNKIYKYYEIDGQRTCTSVQACKQLVNEDIIYKTSNGLANIQRYECTTECENNTAWYQNNIDNVCTNVYYCTVTEEGYTQLTKRALDGHCVEQCKNVDQIYYEDVEQNIYCVSECKIEDTTYVYKVEEFETSCTDQTQCSQLGDQYYTIDETRNYGCTTNCTYSKLKYLYDSKCIYQCPGEYNFVKADTESAVNFQCVKDCGVDENDISKVWYLKQNEKKCRDSTECSTITFTQDYQTIIIHEYLIETYNSCIDPRQYQCYNLYESRITNSYEIFYNASDTYQCKLDHCKSYSSPRKYYLNMYDPDYKDCSEDCDGVVYQLKLEIYNYPVNICNETKENCPPAYPTLTGDLLQYEKIYQNVSQMIKYIPGGNNFSTVCLQYCYKDTYSSYVSAQNNGECVYSCGEAENGTSYAIFFDEFEGYCKQSTTCEEGQRTYQFREQDNSTELTTYCFEKCLITKLQLSFRKDNNSNECVLQCEEGMTWQYLDDELVCSTSNTTCAYNETVKQYLLEDTYECIEENSACHQLKENITYYKDEVNHICKVNYCKKEEPVYIDKYDKDGHNCYQYIEECTENNHIYYRYIDKEQNINSMICDTKKESCPPTGQDEEEFQFVQNLVKITESKQCIEKCTEYVDSSGFYKQKYYAKYDDDTQCLEDHCVSSNIKWIITNDGENQCTNSITCPTDKQKTIDIDEFYNFCMQKCSDYNFIAMSNQPSSGCIQICDTVWYKDDQDENICFIENEFCNEVSEDKLYFVTDTHQCIPESDNCFSTQYPNKYIKDQSQHVCNYNNCYSNGQDIPIYYNEYKQDWFICYDQCDNTKYKYYVTDTQYVYICDMIGKSCPPVTPDTEDYEFAKKLTVIDGNQDECVDNCWQYSDRFRQDLYNNYCFEQCNDLLMIEYGGFAIELYNKFQQSGTDMVCLEEVQCKNVPTYTKSKIVFRSTDKQHIEPFLQCVDKCEFISWYSYHDDYFCVDKCQLNEQEFVWYNNGTDNLCTTQTQCGTTGSEVASLPKITEDNQCVDTCPKYISANNDKQCVNNCDKKYYIIENEKKCTNVEKCKDISDKKPLYKQAIGEDKLLCQSTCVNSENDKIVWYNHLDPDNEEYICVDQKYCGEGGIYDLISLSKTTSDNQCIDFCKNAVLDNFVKSAQEQNQCVENCGVKNIKQDDGNDVQELKVYYLQSGIENICTDEVRCKDIQNGYKRIKIDNRQCIQDCDSYNVWFYPQEIDDYICTDLQKCELNNIFDYGNKYENLNKKQSHQCVEKCLSNDGTIEYVYYYDENEGYKCTREKLCKNTDIGFQYHLGQECIENCDNVWYYYTIDPQEADAKMCLTNDKDCTSVDGKNMQSGNQCVENCIDTKNTKFIKSEGSNICVEKCEENEFAQDTTYTCITSCAKDGDKQLYQYKQDSSTFCTEKDCETMSTQEKTYHIYNKKSSQIECVVTCPDSYSYVQENVCSEECTGEYAYSRTFNQVKNPQCNDKCKYTLSSDQKKICTYTQQTCEIPEENQSDELKLKMLFQDAKIDRLCVESCGSLLSDTSSKPYVWYYDNNNWKQCVDETSCYEIYSETQRYKLTTEENSIQCVQDCGIDKETNKANVWYNYQYENYCKDQTICNFTDINYLKIAGIQCLERCTIEEYRFVSPDDDKICTNNCEKKFYINEYLEFQCTKNDNCKQISTTEMYKLSTWKEQMCQTVCNEINVKQVWYESETDYICLDQTDCNIEDEQLKQLVKITTDNQCVDKCSNALNDKFVKSNTSVNECINNCDYNQSKNFDPYNTRNKYFYNNPENICTQETTCRKLTGLYISKDFMSSQCLEKCGNDYVWYIYTNGDYSENICLETTICNLTNDKFVGDQYQHFNKNQNGQCVETCNEGQVWFNNDEQNICTTDKCGDENTDLQQLIKITTDNQCIDLCYNTQNYKFIASLAETNKCISKCQDLIYEQDQDAVKQVYYFNETEQENVCTEQYTCKAFNDSYIRHDMVDAKCVIECDDDNVWFTQNKEDIIENICTETNKCDLQDVFDLGDKYINYDKKQNKQCVQKCEQYYYEQDEEKICTQCNQDNQKVEGDKCVIQQDDGKISNGVIAGIIIAILVVVVIAICLTIVIRKKNQKTKITEKRSVEMMVSGHDDQNIIEDA